MKKYLFKIVLSLVVLIILVVTLYYIFSSGEDTTVIIRNNVFQTEVVRDIKDLEKGLSGRQDIGDDQAMLFIFDSKQKRVFWMKDMNFNIDLLWIDGNTIVGYEKNMPAPAKNTPDNSLPKYYSDREVDKVLEMKAGVVDKLGIKSGDVINIKWRD